jgi:phosphatidylinositol-3-phosphatase
MGCAIVLGLSASAAGCNGSITSSAPSQATPASQPTSPVNTQTTVPATGPPMRSGKRIVVVFMENENAGNITGAPCCPYETLLARRGIDFTHYYGITYPSRPNYLAFAGGSTFGQSGNDNPLPTIRADNLFQQLSAAGISWRAWAEAYPGGRGRCYLGPTAPNYAMRHVAPLMFTDVATTRLCANVVPREPARLPHFLWVTPDMCNDDHDCPASVGDRWLHAHVPAWLGQGAEVFITFDTGSSDTTHGGGRVYAVLIGGGHRGRTDPAVLTHYSALAGIERAFHLRLLGAARTAQPVPF